MRRLNIEYQKKLENIKMDLYTEGSIMMYNSFHGSFNPNSNKQIATILFDQRYCGFEPIKRSEGTKAPSCDKEVLTYFKERGSKICELILEFHTASKLHSTYLEGMKENIVNGRIHTNYHLDVAITGRTSSCVAAGTMVDVVRDLSRHPEGVPIEDVKVGDYVYCYDNNCELAIKKVLWSGKTGTKKVVRVYWSSKIGSGKNFKGHIDVTPEHKIRRIDGTYTPACELKCGDRVLSLTRLTFGVFTPTTNEIHNHVITKIEYLDNPIDVYNLEVEEFHNFIANGICVKNSNPNCQNIPKKSDIKSIFVPDPGYVFIDADYKQMELLVSTFYTGDELMIEAIKSGDAHEYIAKMFFGVSEVTETNRRYIKSINFGVLYGMGHMKLAKQLGILPNEAKDLIEEYFKLLKKTHEWVKRRRHQAEHKGYVVSKFGRIRYYKTKEYLKGQGESNKEEYNSAVNHPIQSVASDLMLYGLIKWRNRLKELGLYQDKAYIALQVHDSITTCVQEQYVSMLAVEKKKVLEDTHFKFMTLPLTVDVEVGYSWGDLKKLDI
jgi:DNA polymerase I-like protein with 3'-5' exonuclease and polymerase domains